MYRVLYRKWRPRKFSDVVGQEHITGTLLSQINENRISHAYLFTGSRGTGKTTCSKILAKAVNCPNSVNGEPCNCCEICASIDNGSNLDIVEMDAASNRNIEDIREVLNQVNFPPSRSKYRVYIIDEVHMLTTFAFNALLKTLEEPPEYVCFVLATTEVQKMPATILSRCQRFDFRRIEPEVIAKRLMYVAAEEGASLDEDAGEYIAKLADGGMRDSLSLLDRCLSLTDNVTSQTVSECSGLIGREYIYDLLRAIGARDTAKCLNILDNLHRNSCDTERLCFDLTEAFRNFLVLKTVKNPEKLIVCTANELETIRQVADLFTNDGVIYSLGVLSKTAENIRNSANRRTEAELAFVRLCSPEADNSAEALLERISRLEKQIEELKKNGVPAEPKKFAVSEAPEPVFPVASAAPAAAVGQNTAPEKQSQPSVSEIKKSPAASDTAPGAFAGFAAALDSGGGYASAFAQLGDEDDAPAEAAANTPAPAGGFDFESFMANAANTSDDEPAFDIPGDDGVFFEESFPDINEMEPPEDDGYVPFVPEGEQPVAPVGPAAVRPQTSAPSAASNGRAPFDPRRWSAVVRAFEQNNPWAIGMLSGAEPTVSGDSLFIRISENMFAEPSDVIPLLSPVLEEHTGTKYKIHFI